MAKGIVGGTRSKIRGVVGSEVYQITTDEKGYTQQIVKAREQSRTYSNTEAQAKNRMCMGMIQRIFHALPQFLKDAYANVDRGSLSFQYFAKLNYYQVRSDMEEHWTGSNLFDWRNKRDMTPPAGPWIFTRGNIGAIPFNRVMAAADYNNGIFGEIHGITDKTTIGQMLTQMNLQQGDKVVLICFRKNLDTSVPSITQFSFNVQKGLNMNKRVEATNVNEIIRPEDTDLGECAYLIGQDIFSIGWEDPNPDQRYRNACYAWLTIRQTDQGTKFSSSQFAWIPNTIYYYYVRNTPRNAFAYWKQKL